MPANLRAADQTVQLHSRLPRRSARASQRRRTRGFHLIAPYESDPRKWERPPVDRSVFAKQYRISTSLASLRERSRVLKVTGTCSKSTSSTKKPNAPMLPARHAESKLGLLSRRHVLMIDESVYRQGVE